MIIGTVTSQGVYADNKDICELLISKVSSDRLPHNYRQKKPIHMTIGIGKSTTKCINLLQIVFKVPSERDKTEFINSTSSSY